jgi:hypothetical protein
MSGVPPRRTGCPLAWVRPGALPLRTVFRGNARTIASMAGNARVDAPRGRLASHATRRRGPVARGLGDATACGAAVPTVPATMGSGARQLLVGTRVLANVAPAAARPPAGTSHSAAWPQPTAGTSRRPPSILQPLGPRNGMGTAANHCMGTRRPSPARRLGRTLVLPRCRVRGNAHRGRAHSCRPYLHRGLPRVCHTLSAASPLVHTPPGAAVVLELDVHRLHAALEPRVHRNGSRPRR